MRLTIELDRVDGRWIAEVPELNILLYEESRPDAIQRAESAAREILLDRIAMESCHPIRRMPRSTLRLSSWPSVKARRVFAALQRIGWRQDPDGRFPQNHEGGHSSNVLSFDDRTSFPLGATPVKLPRC
jgi:hypothetical protein